MIIECENIIFGIFAGLTSRDFRGFPSLQEVECGGETLKPELKLMSLHIYTLPDSTVLASLNVYTNNCITFGEYSSCMIQPADTQKSKVRILVHDLEEGGRRQYGCTANALNSLGHPVVVTWELYVRRRRKFFVLSRLQSTFLC